MQFKSLTSSINSNKWLVKVKKYIGVLLLIITVIIGFLTYKDYGVSWDESSQHLRGQNTYDYLFVNHKTILNFGSNCYGAAYELPLIILEKSLHLTDVRSIFLMRHLITHLFFLLSAFVFFLLIDYLYNNKWLAAIGFLLLVTNPLIYGHSFFNTKDIPFVSMFIICFMLCAWAFNKKSYLSYIALGVGCGVLTDIRIMGILMTACVGLFFLIDFVTELNDRPKLKKIIFLFIAFMSSTSITTYLFWPYLWQSPFNNFGSAFMEMAKYPWPGTVLFSGKLLTSTEEPWSYSIVWFLITNPIIYLVAILFGTLYLLFRLVKKYKTFLFNEKERNNLIYLLCFSIPVLLVVVFHTILYDSWRHLYFIYPSAILLAIYGLNKLFKTRIKWVALTIIYAGIGYSVYYIIDNYPFEHIYFNSLVNSDEPEHLRENWDLDYWGTSYKQAFEYILNNDKSDTINIAAMELSGLYNSFILKPEDRKRINFVYSFNNADYAITTYRFEPEGYTFYKTDPETHMINTSPVFYSIKVLNSSILTVYKLK